MPVVQINLVEGRDDESIEKCLKAVAQAVHETLGAPLPSIRVIANQVPANRWVVGDKTKAEMEREKAGK